MAQRNVGFNLNIGMRCIDLFESPEADLDTLRQAQRAATQFSGWLTRKNESVPLDDTSMFQAQTLKGDRLWLVRARDVGVELFSVYFGLGWNPRPHRDAPRAYVTTATIEGQKAILLIMMLTGDDPGTRTDLAYGIRWNDFIHEFTHVLDYQRGYLKHKTKQEKNAYQKPSPAKYYNSPIEFNAFYKQGLDKALNKLARLAEPDAPGAQDDPAAYVKMMQQHFRTMPYAKFKKLYSEFDLGWLGKINKTYRRKLERRFYKLYRYVQQTWPDMAAIRDHQAEMAEIDARLAAEDAVPSQ